MFPLILGLRESSGLAISHPRGLSDARSAWESPRAPLGWSTHGVTDVSHKEPWPRRPVAWPFGYTLATVQLMGPESTSLFLGPLLHNKQEQLCGPHPRGGHKDPSKLHGEDEHTKGAGQPCSACIIQGRGGPRAQHMCSRIRKRYYSWISLKNKSLQLNICQLNVIILLQKCLLGDTVTLQRRNSTISSVSALKALLKAEEWNN